MPSAPKSRLPKAVGVIENRGRAGATVEQKVAAGLMECDERTATRAELVEQVEECRRARARVILAGHQNGLLTTCEAKLAEATIALERHDDAELEAERQRQQAQADTSRQQRIDTRASIAETLRRRQRHIASLESHCRNLTMAISAIRECDTEITDGLRGLGYYRSPISPHEVERRLSLMIASQLKSVSVQHRPAYGGMQWFNTPYRPDDDWSQIEGRFCDKAVLAILNESAEADAPPPVKRPRGRPRKDAPPLPQQESYP